MKRIIRNNRELTENINALMKKRGIENITELAKGSGINCQTLYSIYRRPEDGCTLETVRKLAEFFNTKIDRLIYVQDLKDVDIDTGQFLEKLDKLLDKNIITQQRYRTFKGQALCGDMEGAMKGLTGILERSKRKCQKATAQTNAI